MPTKKKPKKSKTPAKTATKNKKKKKAAAKTGAAKTKKPSAKKSTSVKKSTSAKRTQTTKRGRNSFAYGVRSMGPLRLASIVAADPASAWGAMQPLMRERGLKGQALAAFTMSDAKTIKSYAASVVVDEGQTIEAPLVETRIDQSSYAYTSFVGPYDKLGETWGWFVGHVKNIGHTIDMSRPCLEIYKSDGKRAADKLPKTELCIPV